MTFVHDAHTDTHTDRQRHTHTHSLHCSVLLVLLVAMTSEILPEGWWSHQRPGMRGRSEEGVEEDIRGREGGRRERRQKGVLEQGKGGGREGRG